MTDKGHGVIGVRNAVFLPSSSFDIGGVTFCQYRNVSFSDRAGSLLRRPKVCIAHPAFHSPRVCRSGVWFGGPPHPSLSTAVSCPRLFSALPFFSPLSLSSSSHLFHIFNNHSLSLLSLSVLSVLRLLALQPPSPTGRGEEGSGRRRLGALPGRHRFRRRGAPLGRQGMCA